MQLLVRTSVMQECHTRAMQFRELAKTMHINGELKVDDSVVKYNVKYEPRFQWMYVCLLACSRRCVSTRCFPQCLGRDSKLEFSSALYTHESKGSGSPVSFRRSRYRLPNVKVEESIGCLHTFLRKQVDKQSSTGTVART